MKAATVKTEELIRQTARHIFFTKGHLHAKMEEIAKEAGINRALLHYYFRNREKLFEQVLTDAMEDSFYEMFRILSAAGDFEQRIRKAVYHIVDCLARYPFIESFIIAELNKESGSQFSLSAVKLGKDFTRNFLKEIDVYLRERGISYLRPEDFVVNMMALCAYPASTKPIIQKFLGYSEKTYQTFLTSRKEMLVKLVLLQ